MEAAINATETLARYAASTRFEQYPAEVIARAKIVAIDSIGCALGGVVSRLGRTMIDTVAASGETGPNTIIGATETFGTASAALVNGTSANALDFDETLGGIGHPSATVVPAALATAEAQRSSGKDFLNAILVGYDVGNRIGRAIQPTHERITEVWNVGTWQTLGAAAAAARILGLDESRTRHAYGIAGATAPLPNSQKWGWPAEERPIHWVKEPTGWASWSGTMGALLAAKGFVGNRFILDGSKGFWIMAGSDRCDFEGMVAGLGAHYGVMDLSLKPYPCCRWQHSALDCVDAIVTARGLRPEDVATVAVHSFDHVAPFGVYRPDDMVDAQFSIPHSVTMLLHGVPRGPAWFSEENMHGGAMTGYSHRVTIHEDDELNRYYHTSGDVCARVEITTSTGETFTETSRMPSGSPSKFPSDAAVRAKFLSLAEPVLGGAAERLLGILGDLDSVEDMTAVTALLRPVE